MCSMLGTGVWGTLLWHLLNKFDSSFPGTPLPATPAEATPPSVPPPPPLLIRVEVGTIRQVLAVAVTGRGVHTLGLPFLLLRGS